MHTREKRLKCRVCEEQPEEEVECSLLEVASSPEAHHDEDGAVIHNGCAGH